MLALASAPYRAYPTCIVPPVDTLNDISACPDDYENFSPEASVNVGTELNNKRKECDSLDAAQLSFSGPPEHLDADPLTDRKNESHIAASAAVITTCAQNPLVSESKTKEPKVCGRCPKTLKDTPALKRHCSEVHKQDIDGNSISIGLFPCHITTCRKHTEPFKRREKLANHIRTFHTEIIKGQEVKGRISSGERQTALTTNDTAELGNDVGGNHEAARVSARAHHDSAELGVWYPTLLEELLSPPIAVQSTLDAEACEMVLCYNPSKPLDTDFHPSSTSEKCNGDTTSSFLDSPSMYTFWNSPLEVDMNQAIRDAVEIPTSAQMPNEGSLDLNGVIDPALIQSFPSVGKHPKISSQSALPEMHSGFFRHTATGGWPVTVDKTVTVQYDTIDEAKQALLDARKKTLQKLQFINQQIENLEGRKQNRNETVGGLESVENSFL